MQNPYKYFASLFFDVLLIVHLFIEIEQLSTATLYFKFVSFSAHLGYIRISLFVHIKHNIELSNYRCATI